MNTDDRTAIRRLLGIGALIFIVIAMASGRTEQVPSPAPSPAASPAASPASASVSQRWVVVMDKAPGCSTREQMDKIVNFSVRKDWVAMNRVWDTCRTLREGTEVFVEDMPVFSDNLCVRLVGETTCVWTNKAAVKPMEAL
jgi:hypothetical protein